MKVNVTWVPGASSSAPANASATTSFEVNAFDTVDSLKQQILGQKGISIESQRLVYSGKELEGEKTLDQCKIEDGVTIHLLVKNVPASDAQQHAEPKLKDSASKPESTNNTEQPATPAINTSDTPTETQEMKSVDDQAAIYIVNVASSHAIHLDDNGDKLGSTRYGDVRDQFSQWNLVPVDGAESTYFIVNVASAAALHCDGSGDNLCSTRFGDVRDGYSQWRFDAVADVDNAFYIENIMTKLPLHLDGNGDGLCSTRYGECRDGFSQWTFEEA
eukprot:m.61640 g.61640  ORF g.61640 m.61640 type:complete len:274 (+) comp23016_c0_seq1:79-900(+)